MAQKTLLGTKGAVELLLEAKLRAIIILSKVNVSLSLASAII
jgi:hypothetical protein